MRITGSHIFHFIFKWYEQGVNLEDGEGSRDFQGGKKGSVVINRV